MTPYIDFNYKFSVEYNFKKWEQICHLAVSQKEERLKLRDISCTLAHVSYGFENWCLNLREKLKNKTSHIQERHTHFELTPWSTVILEKPIHAKLVKKCFAFRETRRSIFVSTTDPYPTTVQLPSVHLNITEDGLKYKYLFLYNLYKTLFGGRVSCEYIFEAPYN
jgi:hypothetical protein